MFNDVFLKIVQFVRYVENSCRPGQDTDNNIIGSMRISRWVPKATNTHSQYVTRIAFPPQKWLHEGASVLRLYIYCPCIKLYLFSS